jgi:hypothetical protein
MWLACYTQQEIADATGWSQPTVKSFIENGSVADLDKTDQLSAEHATDFTPPIYNIWKQQEKTKGSSHFGNSEVRWVWITCCNSRQNRSISCSIHLLAVGLSR